MKSWVKKWKKNNWFTTTGQDVQNRDLLERLDHLCSISMIRPKFVSKCALFLLSNVYSRPLSGPHTWTLGNSWE